MAQSLSLKNACPSLHAPLLSTLTRGRLKSPTIRVRACPSGSNLASDWVAGIHGSPTEPSLTPWAWHSLGRSFLFDPPHLLAGETPSPSAKLTPASSPRYSSSTPSRGFSTLKSVLQRWELSKPPDEQESNTLQHLPSEGCAQSGRCPS